MKGNLFLESLGYIIKKEKLGLLETNVEFKDLILEDIDPFPGYYHMVPGDQRTIKPRFIFFIIKPFSYWNTEKIIRKTRNIKEQLNHWFDASPGQVSLYNKTYCTIRIYLKNYSIIPDLIESYKKEGIEFRKRKNVKPYYSIIKVIKYFDLEQISNGIFKDLDNPERHYIQIPVNLDWKSFEKITVLLKNNLDYKGYDAALSSIYRKAGLVDFIRIYDNNTNLNKLKLLQKAYLEEIERQIDPF